jgi:glycosyltransferase involved in cell wall biosynthesis
MYAACMPTTMIGYDALPMTEPENYRFAPGTASLVSRYFQRLADVDTVVCISQYARDRMLTRLRRDPAMTTTVAHPGGDHIAIEAAAPAEPPRFVRLGTLEARKQPLEILSAFRLATGQGMRAELVFVGSGSASDAGINAEVRAAAAQGIGVRWIQGAGDAAVRDLVRDATAFLSTGVEGYGIPVLEAIRLGTPVLFDGIQPAAELMVGRGAHHVDASTAPSLARDLHRIASGDPIALRASCAPTQVPCWQDFAERVAAAVVG